MKTDKAAKVDMTNLFRGFYTLPGSDEAFDKADRHAAGECGCPAHGKKQGHNANEMKEGPDVTILDIALPGPPSPEQMRELLEMLPPGMIQGVMDNLPALKETMQDIALNRQFFHQGVKFLADAERWFMPPINELCRMLDGMIEDGVVQLKHDIPRHGQSIGVGVSSLAEVRATLTFMLGIKNGKADMAAVLLPKGWWRKMIANPFFRLGGVVTMASQACDFYHSVQPEQRRSHAWEAQFLLAALQKQGFYKLNRYQRWLLEEFPRGLGSVHKDYLYKRQPFVPKTVRAKGREQKGPARKPAKILTAGWEEVIGYPLWRK